MKTKPPTYKEVKKEMGLTKESSLPIEETKAEPASSIQEDSEMDATEATSLIAPNVQTSTLEEPKAEPASSMQKDSANTLEETMFSMLYLGSLIYTLANLKHVANKFGLRTTEDLEPYMKGEKLPFDYYDIKDNTKKFEVGEVKKFEVGEVPGQPMNASAVENMITGVEEFNQACGERLTVRGLEAMKQFGDTKSDRLDPKKPFAALNNFDAEVNSRELVYGITVSKAMNKIGRITVTFRGSVEPNDWLHNITIPFEEIRLRINEKDGMAWLVEGSQFTLIQIDIDIAKDLEVILQGRPIRVHRGFLSYLFKPQEVNGVTKYKAIARNLKAIFNSPDFVDFELFVTGHSLGGSLCTLLSFLLAYDDSVQTQYSRGRTADYVTCVSFASPYVGDEGWQAAFQLLEARNRLRHIRVSNEHDFIPLGPPPFGFTLDPPPFGFTLWPKYCHTGVNIHLWPRGHLGVVPKKPYISYEGTRESIGGRIRLNWKWLTSGSISRLPLRLFLLLRSNFRGSFLLQLVMTLPILAVPVLSYPLIPVVCAVRGFFVFLFPWFRNNEWLYSPDGALADLDPGIKLGLVGGLGVLQLLAILFHNTMGVVKAVTHGLEDYHANMDLKELPEKYVTELYEDYARSTLDQIDKEIEERLQLEIKRLQLEIKRLQQLKLDLNARNTLDQIDKEIEERQLELEIKRLHRLQLKITRLQLEIKRLQQLKVDLKKLQETQIDKDIVEELLHEEIKRLHEDFKRLKQEKLDLKELPETERSVDKLYDVYASRTLVQIEAEIAERELEIEQLQQLKLLEERKGITN